eukprot:5412761-Prymnesium_polylepis.1
MEQGVDETFEYDRAEDHIHDCMDSEDEYMEDMHSYDDTFRHAFSIAAEDERASPTSESADSMEALGRADPYLRNSLPALADAGAKPTPRGNASRGYWHGNDSNVQRLHVSAYCSLRKHNAPSTHPGIPLKQDTLAVRRSGSHEELQRANGEADEDTNKSEDDKEKEKAPRRVFRYVFMDPQDNNVTVPILATSSWTHRIIT